MTILFGMYFLILWKERKLKRIPKYLDFCEQKEGFGAILRSRRRAFVSLAATRVFVTQVVMSTFCSFFTEVP